MKEIWKDIKGYEGLYQVSNLGMIKKQRIPNKHYRNSECLERQKEKIITKGTLNSRTGYLITALYNKDKRKWITRLVHRLVAEAFIPNTLNKKEVNHINGNKQDNRVENLEWLTPKENSQHAYDIGLNPRKVPIIQLKNGVEIARYKSIREAEKNTGIKESYISGVITGRHKTTCGYQWRYVNV